MEIWGVDEIKKSKYGLFYQQGDYFIIEFIDDNGSYREVTFTKEAIKKLKLKLNKRKDI